MTCRLLEEGPTSRFADGLASVRGRGALGLTLTVSLTPAGRRSA